MYSTRHRRAMLSGGESSGRYSLRKDGPLGLPRYHPRSPEEGRSLVEAHMGIERKTQTTNDWMRWCLDQYSMGVFGWFVEMLNPTSGFSGAYRFTDRRPSARALSNSLTENTYRKPFARDSLSRRALHQSSLRRFSPYVCSSSRRG